METLKKTGIFSNYAVNRAEESSKEDLKNEILQDKEWLKKYTVFGGKLTESEKQAESDRLDKMSDNDLKKESLLLGHKLDLIQKKKSEIDKKNQTEYEEGVKNGTRVSEGWPDPSYKRASAIISPTLSKEQLMEIEAKTAEVAEKIQLPYDRIPDELLHETTQKPMFNALREFSGAKDLDSPKEKKAAILANKYEYVKGAKAVEAANAAKAEKEVAAPVKEAAPKAPKKEKKAKNVVQKAKDSVRALRVNVTREINKRRFGGR